jgi:UDP-glucuronate 4-epimerase
MVKLLGPNRVTVREGIRRVVAAKHERLNTAHHVVGEPAEA